MKAEGLWKRAVEGFKLVLERQEGFLEEGLFQLKPGGMSGVRGAAREGKEVPAEITAYSKAHT